MINKFQKMLYFLGVISPYNIILSICLSIRIFYFEYLNWSAEQNKMSLCNLMDLEDIVALAFLSIPFYMWIVIALLILILIYHVLFLKISICNLAKIDFQASNTPEENDKFAQCLSVTYLIPILELIVTTNIFENNEKIRICFLFGISLLEFLICMFSNKTYGSPVYLGIGYHFHTVQIDGGKSYILMSKTKHFRNKSQVKKVIRLFEDLLVDVS